MKTNALLLALCLGIFSGGHCSGQSGLPEIPELLTGYLFQDTNFLSVWGDDPLSQTNLTLVPTWDNYGLQVDATNAAWLSYAMESEGYPNLFLTNGTISIWVVGNWTSSGLGGTGPGVWSRIIDVGQWTSNASYGWFSLYTDPAGDNLLFSAQSNDGVQTNYLFAPIAWDRTTWHQIVLAYSSLNTCLYLDGALATNGPGISILPPPEALSNGFYVLSDSTGMQQFHGQADELWIYGNQETDTNEIASEYAYQNAIANPPPHIGSFNDGDPSPPGGGGGGGSGTNGGGPTADGIYSPPYGSNDFWLQILPVGTNAYNTDTNSATLILWGTIADIDYQIQMTTNIQTSNVVWTPVGDVLGSEVTNFTATTFSMLGFPTAFFQALPYTLDSDGDGLPDWWELKYSTADFPLSPISADTGNTGIPDGYKEDSAGDGWNNLQKYQMGVPPNVWVTPPPAADVAIAAVAGSTNDVLSWDPAGGSVSYYEILDSSGDEITELSASATNFTFSPTSYSALTVRAYYANGTYSDSSQATTYLPSLNLPITFTPGPGEQIYLVVPSMPTNLSKIRFDWVDADDSIYGTLDYDASNLVNGIGLAPVFVTNGNPVYFWDYQLIDANSNSSATFELNFYEAEDGGDIFIGNEGSFSTADRAVLIDQNLKFLLREATPTVPFSYFSSLYYDGYLAPDPGPWETGQPELCYARPATSTNYEYYGPRRYIPDYGYSSMIIGAPILENFMWRNFVFNPGDFATNVWGAGGTFDSVQDMRAVYNPEYVFTGDPTQSPASLAFSTTNSPFLIEGLTLGSLLVGDVGVTTTDYGYTVASNVKNCFGLDLQNVSFGTNVVFPGNSGDFPDTNFLEGTFSVNFANPSLNPVDFYFASQSAYINGTGSLPPIPGAPGFSPTNTSPLLITAVGQPITVAGWAKEEILNGGYGKFAYAEQYFDKAYLMDTNGNPTTNQTGLLSPFGEFFPTQPGPAALVTMPEVNSGIRGTAIVNVVSLQVDANHDGTMDTSFGGPDTTTANKPYAFWINNDCDYSSGPSDPGQDIDNPKHPDYNSPNIPSQRDLEDWARLWICGLPTPLPSNYSVTLGWTNIQSGSPAINLVKAIETNGGTLYLTDTNVGADQAEGRGYSAPSYKFAQITPTNSYTFPNAYLTSSGTNFFLFEGAGIGCGELQMTITQGTNTLATSSVFLNLHNVRDFYERSIITNNLTGHMNEWTGGLFQVQPALVPDPNPVTNMIVFVHGAANTEFTWLARSDTLFKRMYWDGYHGQLASVRWQSPSRRIGTILNYGNEWFDRSELIALKSASALTNYLYRLQNRYPGYPINLLPHSAGGILVSEAVEQGAQFNNMILYAAAVSAGCYDANAPTNAELVSYDTGIHITPDWQPLGYHGYYTNFTGRIVSYYNTNDSLMGLWVYNQEENKPMGDFSYDGTNCWLAGFWGRTRVTDTQVTRAMIARSRTMPIGGLGPTAPLQTQGVINTPVDFSASPYNVGTSTVEHSAYFTRPIQTSTPIYDLILTQFETP